MGQWRWRYMLPSLGRPSFLRRAEAIARVTADLHRLEVVYPESAQTHNRTVSLAPRDRGCRFPQAYRTSVNHYW